jgi:nitrogen fixation protein
MLLILYIIFYFKRRNEWMNERLLSIKESDLVGAILLLSEGKPLNLKAVIDDVNWLIEQVEKKGH